jgi:hypothetical protein
MTYVLENGLVIGSGKYDEIINADGSVLAEYSTQRTVSVEYRISGSPGPVIRKLKIRPVGTIYASAIWRNMLS